MESNFHSFQGYLPSHKNKSINYVNQQYILLRCVSTHNLIITVDTLLNYTVTSLETIWGREVGGIHCNKFGDHLGEGGRGDTVCTRCLEIPYLLTSL